MGVEKKRERERAGWGGGGWESKVSATSASQSESRHQNVAQTARLTGERWCSPDSGPGMAFIEGGS
jgi:hypothetical protein